MMCGAATLTMSVADADKWHRAGSRPGRVDVATLREVVTPRSPPGR